MSEQQLYIESALLTAIEKNELSLSYQAIVDFQTGKISGIEAFLRWNHEQLGLVSPSTFLHIAEQTNTIHTIGEWVTTTACRDIRQAIDAGIAVPPVALNFSPNQFKDEKIVEQLNRITSEFQLTSAHLVIEITEGVLMEDAKNSHATLQLLKNNGYSIALDDFGTGYSSLSYLKSFSFDKVKIDREFICNLSTNNQDAAIVVAVVGMAHSLGMKVVAEGVESEAQCIILRDNMVDEMQGYFFEKPTAWNEVCIQIQQSKALSSKLLRFSEHAKTLLLVDDDTNILLSLKRLFRRDGYEILTANSGQEGLDILEKNDIDVVISDQRMPNMTGVEFLGIVKLRFPDTIRIVLSGYTELNSVTDAINEGSIFRFLTKPWEDAKLREYIQEAFLYKRLADDNKLLSLKVLTSNQELAEANRQLSDFIEHKQHQIEKTAQNLDAVIDVLRYMPFGLIGLNLQSQVVFINDKAKDQLANTKLILGESMENTLPELHQFISTIDETKNTEIMLNNSAMQICIRRMSPTSSVLEKILIFTELLN